MTYLEKGFFPPQKDVGYGKEVLNNFIEKGQGKKGKFGEIMRKNGSNKEELEILVFDPLSGQQVGVCWAYQEGSYFGSVEPPIYHSGLIIGDNFTRRGFGSLASDYLGLQLAHSIKKDVILERIIHANGEDKDVIRSIMKRRGAKRTKESSATYEAWIENLSFEPRKIKRSLFVSDLGIRLTSKSVSGLINRSAKEPIAKLDVSSSQISILPINPNVTQLAEINNLFINAKKLGHKIFIKTPFS